MDNKTSNIILDRRNELKSLVRDEITRGQKMDSRINNDRIHELTIRLDELSLLETKVKA